MTHDSQHHRCLQAGTSITKAGQPMGCVAMSQCGRQQWLKQNTGSDCLR